ncbi:hypothetical protein [Ferrimonas marina]|uniref:Integrase n=1 Tax=Ferrimonas marina TaxID=299255 RepID=A0A1M5ZWZ7_9GAMM|nr:hypothetical protein [Ferrimonas marina]SHI28784.1 hypothetical protein SAMN02745129_0605 [Ferrimonas marina]
MTATLYSFALGLSEHPFTAVERVPVATTHADGTPCSYVYDITWDYHGMLAASTGTNLELHFEHIDPARRPGIQRALHAITCDKPLSIKELAVKRYTLQIIADSLGGTDWAQLDVELHYDRFKKALKAQNRSTGVVRYIQSVLRDLCNAGLIEHYIAGSEKFVKECASTTKRRQQHIALPETMASKLFASAIAIVERYHPYRHAISAGYDALYSELDERRARGKDTSKMAQWARSNLDHGVPFDDFYLGTGALCAGEIQVACWLVLLGFSGVRDKEGKSMNQGSYDDSRSYQNKVVPVLHGRISKSEQAGKPKPESWVTHPIVKLALELADDMSEFARKRYRAVLQAQPQTPRRDSMMNDLSSAFLVLDLSRQHKNVIMSGLNRKLPAFAEKYGVRATAEDVAEFDAMNPTRKGQLAVGALLPKLSNHDFRRTYAVFLCRNRLGNLMTLRSQYKHDNTAMTDWYQNGASLAAILDLRLDEDLRKTVEQANLDIHENVLFEIFNEDENLGGFEGRRIKAERDAHQAKYPGQIYMSREEIRTMLRNNTIAVVEHPTGLCFNPDCDRICASEKSTVTCKKEVVPTRLVRENYLPRHQRWVSKFRALNTGRYYMKSILADILTDIKAIEKTLAEHKIPFEPLTDEIVAPGIADVGEVV